MINKLINILVAIIAGFGVLFKVYRAGEKNQTDKQNIKSLENDAKFFKKAIRVKERSKNMSREQLVDSILQPRKDNNL